MNITSVSPVINFLKEAPLKNQLKSDIETPSQILQKEVFKNHEIIKDYPNSEQTQKLSEVKETDNFNESVSKNNGNKSTSEKIVEGLKDAGVVFVTFIKIPYNTFRYMISKIKDPNSNIMWQ